MCRSPALVVLSGEGRVPRVAAEQVRNKDAEKESREGSLLRFSIADGCLFVCKS